MQPNPSTPSAQGPNVDNLRLVHDEISARLARLDSNGDRLDTKATTLLGFVLAVGTLLASQSALTWLKIVSFVFLGLAAIFGVMAMRPRMYNDAPEPDKLWLHMRARTEMATLALITQAKVQVFAANKETHEGKAKSWRWSLIALTVGIVLTVTALAVGSNNDGGPDRQHPAHSQR